MACIGEIGRALFGRRRQIAVQPPRMHVLGAHVVMGGHDQIRQVGLRGNGRRRGRLRPRRRGEFARDGVRSERLQKIDLAKYTIDPPEKNTGLTKGATLEFANPDPDHKDELVYASDIGGWIRRFDRDEHRRHHHRSSHRSESAVDVRRREFGTG